jgi:hypothetical protein
VDVGSGFGTAEMTLLNAKRELRTNVVNCMFGLWLHV